MSSDLKDAWTEFKLKSKKFKITVGMIVVFTIAVFAICANHQDQIIG